MNCVFKAVRKGFQIAAFLLLLISVKVTAQSGFVAGNYYSRQYYIEDIPVGYPFVKFDYYGRRMGVYQVWRRAEWHHEGGGSYVYMWTQYGWQEQWVDGSYYWYEWVNYERLVSY